MNIFIVTLLIFVVVSVYCQENNQHFKTENIDPNSKLETKTDNIRKENIHQTEESELHQKSTDNKQVVEFQQKQLSGELQNVGNQSNSTNVNINQFDIKNLKSRISKMYATIHNKELLISYPLNFSPKIIKTYETSDVLYKGAYQIRDDNKTDKFYCGNSSFVNNKQNLTTTLVKIEEGEQLVKTQYGFNIIIDSIDGTVSQAIKNLGTWEPHFIKVIGIIVKPGNNVLNLGSHIGLQAIVMGKIIGPSGKMFIFEPYEVSNRIVTKNMELNGMKHYTQIYKLGASNNKSQGTLTLISQNTGASFILPSDMVQNFERKTFEIKLDTVDSVLPQNISIDFALIDIQRMELQALQGMKSIIKRSPNLIIMSQWQYPGSQLSTQEQTLQFLDFMVERGYGIFLYEGPFNNYDCITGKMRKLYSIELLLEVSFNDVFFIPESHWIWKSN